MKSMFDTMSYGFDTMCILVTASQCVCWGQDVSGGEGRNYG